MDIAPQITLTPRFVPDGDALFAELQESVAWDERLRARKTASFGVAYNYSGMVYPDVPMHPKLIPLCGHLQEAVGFYPNNCLLNYYPDGSSTMGFHSDSTEELADGTGVAIVSLGSEREIVFRNKADRSIQHVYPLPSGALLYMPNEVQLDWLHGIPKKPGAGPRISLTFRLLAKSKAEP